MKIIYKNTALGMLDHPKTFPIGLPHDIEGNYTEEEKQEFGTSVRKAFLHGGKDLFLNEDSKIQYISNTVLEMYEKNKKKLYKLFDEEHIEKSGVFITMRDSFTFTYYYTVLKSPKSAPEQFFKIMLVQFTKHTSNPAHNMDLFASEIAEKGKEESKVFRWSGYDYPLEAQYAWLIGLILFLKYAEVQTKEVAGNRKIKHEGEKYLNETPHKIEIVDSTYYTTIIRKEGFEVEGHFRWQRYGRGLNEKRLQWINDYQKQGFVRKAKKLSHDHTNGAGESAGSQ